VVKSFAELLRRLGNEKSSQGIGQIIGLIAETAFLTSLLVLNAGVETAPW
jgi:methyl-accepting chemotaxis protein